MCFWWERRDLRYHDGSLYLGHQNVEELARSAGTPLFIQSSSRISENLARLRDALDSRSLEYRIFYSMKANRYPPLVTYIKTLGLCGMDVCSPGEVLLSRQVGFREKEISYTGSFASDEDLDCLRKHPGVWVNCDSLSTIRRLGRLCVGREIGIRINLRIGIGYNRYLRYSGAETTKFGIYSDRFDEALALAKNSGLHVVGLHFHSGCGYLTPHLQQWDKVLESFLWFIDRTPEVKYVNIGGGLGIPLTEDEKCLDLEAWTEIIATRLGRRKVQVWIEPGTYLVKDAGILVLQVNIVEKKDDTVFVGVNGGFNIHADPVFYDLPLEVAPSRFKLSNDTSQSWDRSVLKKVTVAGNINEARDIFARDVMLPPVEEGDYLCFLNAGAYGASMSSNHCMRGQFSEYLLQ